VHPSIRASRINNDFSRKNLNSNLGTESTRREVPLRNCLAGRVSATYELQFRESRDRRVSRLTEMFRGEFDNSGRVGSILDEIRYRRRGREFHERNLGLRASGDPRRATRSRGAPSRRHLAPLAGRSRGTRAPPPRSTSVTYVRVTFACASLTASRVIFSTEKTLRRAIYYMSRSNTRDGLKRGFRPRALSLPRATLRRARMPDSRYGALLHFLPFHNLYKNRQFVPSIFDNVAVKQM